MNSICVKDDDYLRSYLLRNNKYQNGITYSTRKNKHDFIFHDWLTNSNKNTGWAEHVGASSKIKKVTSAFPSFKARINTRVRFILFPKMNKNKFKKSWKILHPNAKDNLWKKWLHLSKRRRIIFLLMTNSSPLKSQLKLGIKIPYLICIIFKG